ncbi:MAG: NAD(+)/NADH kinase [Lachnospiraceae bacterium]|nr:NAD(+)/NADH kinase [Lachnospiraceae bacterium]
MKHFLIRTNESKDQGFEVTNLIKDFLEKNGKTVELEIMNDEKIYGKEEAAVFEGSKRPDAIIVLGGDGTMLRAARDLVEEEIPLLGVNLGSLGYLAEVEKSNITSALSDLISGEYFIEERMMLEGTIIRDGNVVTRTVALNDISVLKSQPFRAINFDVYVNGQFLKSYGADGVIVSTPTGSTGYNLSAGGPIVEPCADLLVLTPVCPHTMNSRSIVLAGEDEVYIEIKEAKNGGDQVAFAMSDGAAHFDLKTGDSFIMRRSDKRTRIIKLNKVSFLEILQRKMND